MSTPIEIQGLNAASAPKPSKQNRAMTFGILITLTLIGFLFRLRNSDIRPLWLDEMHTFQVVNQPATFWSMLETWWTGFMVSDPPLFYIFNWISVGGDTFAPQWKMRIVSILFGTGSIPVVWACIRQVATKSVAITAAGIMAFNTFAIQYGQEYRPYSQLLFFTAVYFTCQIAVAKKFAWSKWGFLVLSAGLLLYTHYFGGFALAAGYLAWGVTLLSSRNRSRTQYIAFISMPVVLLFSYIPIIMYGLSQAQHFSITTGNVGSASESMLRMYLAQKQHTHYWTDLPASLSNYYLGISTVPTLFLMTLTGFGIAISLIYRFKISVIILFTCVIYLGLGYGFYEVMKYPYEPRRSIGALVFLVYFQSMGVCSCYSISQKLKGSTKKYVCFIITGLLLSMAVLTYISQYIKFDASGHRDQPNQADWPAMARYIKMNSAAIEPVAMYSRSGKTWVWSHFSFYHSRYKLQNERLSLTNVSNLQSTLNKGDVCGIWFVICFPAKTPDDLFRYLLEYGQWQNFYGGALVYVAAPEFPKGIKQSAIFAHEEADYALIARGAYKEDYTITFAGPEKGTLQFLTNRPIALLSFSEGRHLLRSSVFSNDRRATPTLYPAIKPGKWNDAINFSKWKPADKNVDITLDDKFQPALTMQYNGSVIYNFYLDRAASYSLTLKVKNDIPGPIDIRLFAGNAGELKPLSFNKADNSFSQLTTTAYLEKGLNELTVYYPSFRRVKRDGRPEDRFNEFIFSRWRLDLNPTFQMQRTK